MRSRRPRARTARPPVRGVRRRGLAWSLALAAVAAALRPDTARGAAARYEISATLDLAARTVSGRATLRWVNPGAGPAEHLILDLHPNRFLHEVGEVDDITREGAYPRLQFEPGSIEISGVERLPDASPPSPIGRARSAGLPASPSAALSPAAPGGPPAGGTPARFRVFDPPSGPPATALEIALDPPVAAGQEVAVAIGFSTRVPERYGPFGTSEQGLTAVAGWYPYLASFDPTAGWQPGAAPDPADVTVELAASPETTIVLGSAVFPAGHAGVLRSAASGVRTFALIAVREAVITGESAAGTRFTFVSPLRHRTHRLAPGPDADAVLRATVEAAVERRPLEVSAPGELTVVEVPLRWNLTTPSDGPVVVSDRSMRVNFLLRGFHEAQVAQAVYAALLRPSVLACEAPADRQWVLQGVAWELADRWLREQHPEHRDVHWWIDWFDFFALVDRFEKAPKVPFVQAFFANAQSEDDLRENVFTYARRGAPAHLVFARLDRALGADTVQAAVHDYLTGLASGCTTFVAALERASGQAPAAVDAAVRTALAPPPTGRTAIVDPALRPPGERSRYQVVLDSADVEVSSTEFGLAALVAARRRGDYTKDIALNPFVSERSYGFRLGPRLHFGERNDANTYRHNVYAFYALAGLDSGFEDDSRPDVRDRGGVSGFGLRYDYSNVYFYDNPTEQREARLFADWYDPAFASDFGFVRFGGRVAATTPLWTHRTIGAIELLAGFEEPTGGPGVPIQEQFSLGGLRALRGVSVNERLARNIGLARFEVRQDVFPQWDLDLLDIVTYRRPQFKLFLDTGGVDDSAGRALDPEHWALAAGAGVSLVHEVLGFFPGRAYVEVATRLDRRQTDFQVLFGTRQAF